MCIYKQLSFDMLHVYNLACISNVSTTDFAIIWHKTKARSIKKAFCERYMHGNRLFWILHSFEYLLGGSGSNSTGGHHWELIDYTNKNHLNYPVNQVLYMQSPHLHSFRVIKVSFLSFGLLKVACQKIAINVERWSKDFSYIYTVCT